jgi:hypothetical protein
MTLGPVAKFVVLQRDDQIECALDHQGEEANKKQDPEISPANA